MNENGNNNSFPEARSGSGGDSAREPQARATASPAPSSSPSPRAAPRWNHLYRLWEAALALDPLPPFDKWLAQELKKEKRFGRRDRLWYSERLFAALRHAVVALFLHETSRETPKSVAAPDGVAPDGVALDGDASDFDARVVAFGERFGGWSSIRAALREVGSPVFFQWVALRLESTPHPSEPSQEAEAAQSALACDPGAPPSPSQRLLVERIREAVASPEASLALRCLWHGVPLRWMAALERRVALSGWEPSRRNRFLAALETRPPLWLRLRTEADRAAVVEELEGANIKRLQSDGLAFAVDAARSVLALESYRRGRFAIQDWASQRAGARLDARPGESVWDACAGAGGKTLQIAAAQGGEGMLLATDARAHALDTLRERVRAAGFANVRIAPWNGEAPYDHATVAPGGFDRVLVDAPCSGSGTWRRQPDAKYRLSAEGIERFVALQSRLLRHAARAVRPGGRLLYITCSWLPEENEAVVRRFQDEHAEYEIQESGLVGSPDADADTLFVAVMKRG